MLVGAAEEEKGAGRPREQMCSGKAQQLGKNRAPTCPFGVEVSSLWACRPSLPPGLVSAPPVHPRHVQGHLAQLTCFSFFPLGIFGHNSFLSPYQSAGGWCGLPELDCQPISSVAWLQSQDRTSVPSCLMADASMC